MRWPSLRDAMAAIGWSICLGTICYTVVFGSSGNVTAENTLQNIAIAGAAWYLRGRVAEPRP